jgi:hypothetical protein
MGVHAPIGGGPSGPNRSPWQNGNRKYLTDKGEDIEVRVGARLDASWFRGYDVSKRRSR